MDFGEAIKALKVGKRVARAGWNGRGMWLHLVVPLIPPVCDIHPDGCSPHRRPYVEMSDAQGSLVPWLASQTDVLAEDWVVVP